MKNKILTFSEIQKFKVYLSSGEKSAATTEKYLRDVRAFARFAGGAGITGDTSLVDELTAINGLSRKERSLSSKICVYLSELEYGKIKFAVNDSVVRKILPYYLHYYNVCQKKGILDNRSYSEITGLIDKIIGNLPRKLDYAEIDRIIWYCYKSDPVRTSISISLNNCVNAGGK